MKVDGPTTALVVDDSEAIRDSHARTLESAGWGARSLSFEGAMALCDEELIAFALIVVDLHDSRPDQERVDSAAAAGVTSQLPWYDRVAGMRLLYRLDDLRVVSPRMPVVVVASAAMQSEPDLTGRMYELDIVTGCFCTMGIGLEAAWLEELGGAMSPAPSRQAVRAVSQKNARDRWSGTVPRWSSYRALVRTVDRHPGVVRFVLKDGGRPSRPEQKALDLLNARAGAIGATRHDDTDDWRRPRRDALRGLLRRILGWDFPHA